MGVKKLTKKDKVFIASIHSNSQISWDDKMATLMKRFDRSERTIRRWIKKLGLAKKDTLAYSPQFKEAKKRELKEKKYYLISWAQNATEVHRSFLKNMEAYADHLDADIHIIAGRYKNPTSIWNNNNETDEWWDDRVIEYLDANRHDIHKNLTVLSDFKIQPTAVNPLTGLTGITGGKSTVVGHPKVHLETLPALEGYTPKIMMTTGACTLQNYTDSKAGSKASFHHTFGFVVVEVKDDETFFIRQVTASDDGSFTDLNNYVSKGEVTKIDSIAACVMGDIHHRYLDHNIYTQTLDIFEKLTPQYVVLHDIIDFDSINHHERHDPFKQFHKYERGDNLVREEIEDMLDWAEDLSKKYHLVVSKSNHDVFIDRWLVDQDWKKDIPNAREYMKLSLALLDGQAPKGIIPYLLDERLGDRVTTLDLDDSFRVNGWELAVHGHIGTNGSRGSIRQFRKLDTRMVTAHSHTAARIDGALQVGTSTRLRMNYNEGPSNWIHAHVIIHEDKKAQHLIFINGECTTLLDNE